MVKSLLLDVPAQLPKVITEVLQSCSSTTGPPCQARPGLCVSLNPVHFGITNFLYYLPRVSFFTITMCTSEQAKQFSNIPLNILNYPKFSYPTDFLESLVYPKADFVPIYPSTYLLYLSIICLLHSIN